MYPTPHRIPHPRNPKSLRRQNYDASFIPAHLSTRCGLAAVVMSLQIHVQGHKTTWLHRILEMTRLRKFTSIMLLQASTFRTYVTFQIDIDLFLAISNSNIARTLSISMSALKSSTDIRMFRTPKFVSQWQSTVRWV